MNLELSDLQRELVASVSRLLERECDTQQVRAAETVGWDGRLWASLRNIGVPVMGLSVDRGGLGADLLDLALIAEAHGRFLAPVPLIETLVAARTLERCTSESAGLLLDQFIAVGDPLALALSRLERDGERLVSAGAVAQTVLAFDRDELVAVQSAPPDRPLRNLGDSPLAYRSIRSGGRRMVLARGPTATALHDLMVGEWKVLTAAALEGLAAAALEIGVDYAKERTAFGTPIGTFQAVAHRLADAAIDVEGARLIARAAAASARDEPDRFPTLAEMAFAWCAKTAERAAADSLHVHGGYGFTLEYNIQLYLRRAKAWPLAYESIGASYRKIASSLFDSPDGLKRWIFG